MGCMKLRARSDCLVIGVYFYSKIVRVTENGVVLYNLLTRVSITYMLACFLLKLVMCFNWGFMGRLLPAFASKISA